MEEVLQTKLEEKWQGGEEDLRRLSWLRDFQSIRLSGEQVKDSWLFRLRFRALMCSVVAHCFLLCTSH